MARRAGTLLALWLAALACGDGAAEPAAPEPSGVPPDAGEVREGTGGRATQRPDSPDDDPAPPPRSDLRLAFEEIALDGERTAITDFAFMPESDELLLLHKSGEVSHYLLEGDTARQLGGFRLAMTDDIADCGLISLAFDPGFAQNRYVYFAYCENRDYSRVTRHVFDPGDYAATADSGVLVLRAGQDGAPEPWHNIGAIGFDDGGYLWILLGEKADKERAQELDQPLGKVLRIDPERAEDGEGYRVVSENPFAGDPERLGDIAAYGLRSPWRGHLDAQGRLWIGDTGESHGEELDVLHGFDGSNFGWPLAEGACEGDCDGLVDPVASWSHDDEDPRVLDDPEAAPTTRRVAWVGLSYRPNARDRYAGRFDHRLVYGDFCVGFVRAIELDELGGVAHDAHAGHLEGVVSWRQADDGYAYAATYGNPGCQTFPYGEGGLYRAVPAAEP